MVAHEVQRQSGDHVHGLMVVLAMPDMEFPCVVHLDNKWTKEVEMPNDPIDDEGISYVDEDANAFSCQNFDALRAGFNLARKYAAEDGAPVWNEDLLLDTTNDVIEHFVEELGKHKDDASNLAERVN